VSDASIRDAVRGALAGVAPEADLDALPAGANLRDELDLDSMDFLNFVVGLHEALGVDIPEADYAELATLAGCVAYLEARAGSPERRAAPRR
jgi:acyl carrier protein